jgi:hypothetical protein
MGQRKWPAPAAKGEGQVMRDKNACHDFTRHSRWCAHRRPNQNQSVDAIGSATQKRSPASTVLNETYIRYPEAGFAYSTCKHTRFFSTSQFSVIGEQDSRVPKKDSVIGACPDQSLFPCGAFRFALFRLSAMGTPPANYVQKEKKS